MAIVKVNRTDSEHKIYETNSGSKQIGTLFNSSCSLIGCL